MPCLDPAPCKYHFLCFSPSVDATWQLVGISASDIGAGGDAGSSFAGNPAGLNSGAFVWGFIFGHSQVLSAQMGRLIELWMPEWFSASTVKAHTALHATQMEQEHLPMSSNTTQDSERLHGVWRKGVEVRSNRHDPTVSQSFMSFSLSLSLAHACAHAYVHTHTHTQTHTRSHLLISDLAVLAVCLSRIFFSGSLLFFSHTHTRARARTHTHTHKLFLSLESAGKPGSPEDEGGGCCLGYRNSAVASLSSQFFFSGNHKTMAARLALAQRSRPVSASTTSISSARKS